MSIWNCKDTTVDVTIKAGDENVDEEARVVHDDDHHRHEPIVELSSSFKVPHDGFIDTEEEAPLARATS
jgi:hypothetical protein